MGTFPSSDGNRECRELQWDMELSARGDGFSSYGKINLSPPEEGKWSEALLTPAAAAMVQVGMG